MEPMVVADEMVVKVVGELGKQPEKLTFVGRDQAELIMNRVFGEPPTQGEQRVDGSLFGIAREARLITGEIKGILAKAASGEMDAKEANRLMAEKIRETQLYAEWNKVMSRQFTPEELAFIGDAGKKLMPGHKSETGSSEAHEMMLQFYSASINTQREVLNSKQMGLTEAQQINEIAHIESVSGIMYREWMDGRADPLTMMSTVWHDSAKWMPPEKPGGPGEMKLWMHEMMSAVRAKAVAEEYFKAVGYTPEQAGLLSDWIEFQVAHHGFAEYPANLANTIGRPVIDRGVVLHRMRTIKGGVMVMEKTGEPYFMVRNEEALRGMGKDRAEQVDLVRAADSLDGAFDTSFPKYVFGTIESTFNDCENAGDLLVGSFARTFSLNLMDGEVVDKKGMMMEQSTKLFRSELFIAAMALDPEDPVTESLFSMLKYGGGDRNFGQKMLELSKQVHEGFRAWKQKGFEAGKSDYAMVLRGVVVEFDRLYEENLRLKVKNTLLTMDFLNLALVRRTDQSGATGGEGKEYSKFDSEHLRQTHKKHIAPALLGYLSSGLIGEKYKDEVDEYAKKRGLKVGS